MELLIVRHAPAGEREDWVKTGKPDAERPVTKEGREKMKKAAKGLSRLVPELDVIVTSPLLRAAQTAKVLASYYKGSKTIIENSLSPDTSFDDLIAALGKLPAKSVVALVGHDPHLVHLTAWLCGGEGFSLELKKGGVCRLSFKGAARAGKGKLAWLFQPAQLRKLA